MLRKSLYERVKEIENRYYQEESDLDELEEMAFYLGNVFNSYNMNTNPFENFTLKVKWLNGYYAKNAENAENDFLDTSNWRRDGF